MTDKVLCPWCGSEMEIRVGRTGSFAGGPFIYHGWATCNGENCGAESPIVEDIIVKTEEEAADIIKAAALRRYEPPIRPLTMEEALERGIVYIEYRTYDEVQSDPILLHYIWDEWLKKTILAYQMFGIMGENTDIDHPDDYGHTWRCWPRKPTEAERKEAKWND